MRVRVAIRWMLLIATLSTMVFVVYMIYSAKDDSNRSLYLGMFIGLLVALPSQLDSLGLYGEKENHRTILDKQLTEVYSPIHAMIVAVNKHVSAAQARQSPTHIPKIVIPNAQQVSGIFHAHAHNLGNHHLSMWLELELEIKNYNGFTLGRKWQTWFDELEAEYQRLVAELKKLK